MAAFLDERKPIRQSLTTARICSTRLLARLTALRVKSSRRVFFLQAAAAIFALALLTSCAATPPDRGRVPQTIELRDEPQISTFHFPRGVYSLADSDESGFYYRAPRSVVKHAFPGSIPYDGGIFMSKEDHRRLRGYVIWAGGRTKIGDLSGAKYEFRD